MDAEALVRPVVESAGLELWEVTFRKEAGRMMLRVTVDRDGGIDVDTISEMSERLSRRLDLEDFGRGRYQLEVSSPGIDRPLTRRSDYSDWAGHEARLKLEETLAGAKQLSGTIKGIEGDTVLLATPKGDREIPFESIASAKLLLTDELIKATAPLDAEGADLIKMEG